MIRVIDSSVAIKWFLAEEAHPQADRVLEAVIDQPETFAVRLGLTGYDACYAALAYDLKGIWLTFDQKAHQAIRKEKISVYLGQGTPF